jgi:hypothetical protein
MSELARYQEHRQQHAKELARYKQQALMKDQDIISLMQVAGCNVSFVIVMYAYSALDSQL